MSAVWTRPAESSVKKWLTDIEGVHQKLTPWELSFIESITAWVERRGIISLTREQLERVEEIYAKRTPL